MKRKLLSTILVCAIVFGANAQSFTRYSAGINAGTYGAGVWGATNLSDNFVLSAGFSHFGLGLSREWSETFEGFAIDDPNANVPDLGVTIGNPRLRLPHGNLKIGWYPLANGIFSLRLGAYVGVFDLGFSGSIDGYSALREQFGDIGFEMEGASLIPRADGTFDGSFRFGNVVKPYFGFGIGRTIPRNRVGFRFNLGVLYQGDIRLVSDQINLDLANITNEVNGDVDFLDDISGLLRFWPMMNFSLTYRF